MTGASLTPHQPSTLNPDILVHSEAIQCGLYSSCTLYSAFNTWHCLSGEGI